MERVEGNWTRENNSSVCRERSTTWSFNYNPWRMQWATRLLIWRSNLSSKNQKAHSIHWSRSWPADLFLKKKITLYKILAEFSFVFKHLDGNSLIIELPKGDVILIKRRRLGEAWKLSTLWMKEQKAIRSLNLMLRYPNKRRLNLAQILFDLFNLYQEDSSKTNSKYELL